MEMRLGWFGFITSLVDLGHNLTVNDQNNQRIDLTDLMDWINEPIGLVQLTGLLSTTLCIKIRGSPKK